MKRIIISLLVSLLFSIGLYAQAPVGFNYQAAIYKDGAPVSNKSVNLKLDLVDSDGTAYYTEEVKGVKTDTAGFVNVLIGSDAAGLSLVPWGKGMWVSAAVDLGTGTYSPLGRVKLQAVPYALHASAGMTIQVPDKDYGEDRPIFQILDHDSTVLFKVSRSTVEATVTPAGNLSRGIRGGFIVRSRGSEGAPVDRMVVGDGAEFTVDDGVRGVRGGFLVRSRTELSSRGDVRMEYAPRFSIMDGGVSISVEESSYRDLSRGIRGGFLVNLSRTNEAPSRGEQIFSTVSQPLMFLGERESFVTIGQTGGLCDQPYHSSFSIRNRCDVQKFLMQVTPEGTVQAVKTDGLAAIDNSLVSPNRWVFESPMQKDGIVLTKLARWLTVRDGDLKLVNPAANITKNVDSGYRIELGEELANYIEVVDVKYSATSDGKRMGLYLKEEFKMTSPAHIRIVDEADPSIYVNIPVNCYNTSLLDTLNGNDFMPLKSDMTKIGCVYQTGYNNFTLYNEGVDMVEITPPSLTFPKSGKTLELKHIWDVENATLMLYLDAEEVLALLDGDFTSSFTMPDMDVSNENFEITLTDKNTGLKSRLFIRVLRKK